MGVPAWVIGAVINVAGNVLINFGYNVMKLGHDKIQKEAMELTEGELGPSGFPLTPAEAVAAARERKLIGPSWKHRTWLFGVSSMMAGNLLTFGSTAFASVSLLAVLGASQFVVNILFSWAVLHEPVTVKYIIATTFIVAGCIVLVFFGNHSSISYTVTELEHMQARPAWVAYLLFCAGGSIAFYAIYRQGDWRAKTGAKKGASRAWRIITPVAFGLYAALIGTLTMVFSKSLSTLIRTTASGSNQAGNWYTWVMLACFVFVASFWVTRLNLGLQLFPSTVIVPIMQTFWTLLSVLAGMMYFQEWTSFKPISYIMSPLGVALVLIGIALLQPSQDASAEALAEYEPMNDATGAEAAPGIPADVEAGAATCVRNGMVPVSPPANPQLAWGTRHSDGPKGLPDVAAPLLHRTLPSQGRRPSERVLQDSAVFEEPRPGPVPVPNLVRPSPGLLNESPASPATRNGRPWAPGTSPDARHGRPSVEGSAPSAELTAAASMARRREMPLQQLAPARTMSSQGSGTPSASGSPDGRAHAKRPWARRLTRGASKIGMRVLAEAGNFLGLSRGRLGVVREVPGAEGQPGPVVEDLVQPAPSAMSGINFLGLFGVQAGIGTRHRLGGTGRVHPMGNEDRDPRAQAARAFSLRGMLFGGGGHNAFLRDDLRATGRLGQGRGTHGTQSHAEPIGPLWRVGKALSLHGHELRSALNMRVSSWRSRGSSGAGVAGQVGDDGGRVGRGARKDADGHGHAHGHGHGLARLSASSRGDSDAPARPRSPAGMGGHLSTIAEAKGDEGDGDGPRGGKRWGRGARRRREKDGSDPAGSSGSPPSLVSAGGAGDTSVSGRGADREAETEAEGSEGDLTRPGSKENREELSAVEEEAEGSGRGGKSRGGGSREGSRGVGPGRVDPLNMTLPAKPGRGEAEMDEVPTLETAGERGQPREDRGREAGSGRGHNPRQRSRSFAGLGHYESMLIALAEAEMRSAMAAAEAAEMAGGSRAGSRRVSNAGVRAAALAAAGGSRRELRVGRPSGAGPTRDSSRLELRPSDGSMVRRVVVSRPQTGATGEVLSTLADSRRNTGPRPGDAGSRPQTQPAPAPGAGGQGGHGSMVRGRASSGRGIHVHAGPDPHFAANDAPSPSPRDGPSVPGPLSAAMSRLHRLSPALAPGAPVVPLGPGGGAAMPSSLLALSEVRSSLVGSTGHVGRTSRLSVTSSRDPEGPDTGHMSGFTHGSLRLSDTGSMPANDGFRHPHPADASRPGSTAESAAASVAASVNASVSQGREPEPRSPHGAKPQSPPQFLPRGSVLPPLRRFDPMSSLAPIRTNLRDATHAPASTSASASPAQPTGTPSTAGRAPVAARRIHVVASMALPGIALPPPPLLATLHDPAVDAESAGVDRSRDEGGPAQTDGAQGAS